MPRPRSIRAHFTLAASALSLIVLAVIGTGLDLVVRNRIEADVFRDTQRAATQWIGAMGNGSVPHTVPAGARGHLLQLVDSYGRVVYSTWPMSERTPLGTVRPPADDRIQNLTECTSQGGCIMLTAIRVSPQEAGQLWQGETHVVYAGMAEPPILATHRLEFGIAAGILSGVALASWIAWCVVGRTLRPVEAIRARMSEIAIGDLSLRVPEPSGEDEIALLARTANRTLARLEGAVAQQRQFASDASHELRTPIAGLRTRLEEALLYPEDIDPNQTIRSALSATDRLEAITNDLLLLARLRAGESVPPEPIDLAALVAQEAAARVHGVPVRARVVSDVKVHGCRMQLIRVLDNLLDNAQRHAETRVEVTAERVDGQAVVTVIDDGPGIAPQDRERVFERFIRLDDGRHRDPGGSGLGLAISRDIAHAHHGSLRIEDSPRGARFVLRLPLPAAEGPVRSSAAAVVEHG